MASALIHGDCPDKLGKLKDRGVTAGYGVHFFDRQGAVAGLVGIEGGVVSGVINLESSGVEAVGLETTP